MKINLQNHNTVFHASQQSSGDGVDVLRLEQQYMKDSLKNLFLTKTL